MNIKTLISALALGLVTTAAAADCSVEYKAKRGTEYEHSVMPVPDTACTPKAATPFVVSQLAARGFELLTIVKVTPGG